MNCPVGFHEEIILIDGIETCVCMPNAPIPPDGCPEGYSPQVVIIDGIETCVCLPDDPTTAGCEDYVPYFDYEVSGFRLFSNGVRDIDTGQVATSYIVNLWSPGSDPNIDPPTYTFDQTAFPLGGWFDDDGDPTTAPIAVVPPTGLPLTEGSWTITFQNIVFGIDCPVSLPPIITPPVLVADCCQPIAYSGAGSGQSSGLMFSINPGMLPGNFYIDFGTCVVVDKVLVRNQNGVIIGETPYIGTVVPIAPVEQGFWTGEGVYPINSIAGQPLIVRDNLVPAWSLTVGTGCVQSSLTGQGRLTVAYDPAIDGTCIIEVTGNNLAFTVWGVNVICVGEDCDPCTSELDITINECYGKHYHYINTSFFSGTGIFLNSVQHTANGITTTYSPTTPIQTSDTASLVAFLANLPHILYVNFYTTNRGNLVVIGDCDSNLALQYNFADGSGTPVPISTQNTTNVDAGTVKAFVPSFTPAPITLTAIVPPSTVFDTFEWVLGDDLTLVGGTLNDTVIQVVPDMTALNPNFTIGLDYTFEGCPDEQNIEIDLCNDLTPYKYVFPESLLIGVSPNSIFSIYNPDETITWYYDSTTPNDPVLPSPTITLQGLVDWLNAGNFLAIDGVTGIWEVVASGIKFTTFDEVPETPNQGWNLLHVTGDTYMPFALYKTQGDNMVNCNPCDAEIALFVDGTLSGSNIYSITAVLLNGFLTITSYNWNFSFPTAILSGSNSQTVTIQTGPGGNASGSIGISVANCNFSITDVVTLP